MDINKFTDDFVEEWNGKSINVLGANVNFDGRYGTQCMDLWNYWWSELGLTGITRNVDAAAVWETENGTYYKFFDGILPSQPAKKGDVFIYNRQAWGTGYGHIGIVLADLGNSIRVLECNGLGDGYEDAYMNQYGSAPRIHTWPKTNLYGYLRYINQEEEEMASAAEIAQEVLTYPFDRLGEGLSGTISLRGMIQWYDANNQGHSQQIAELRAIVTQLAVTQGVVIDYEAIAKAVATETAKRLSD